MPEHYSVEQCRRLMQTVHEADLHYTRAPSRYDPGHVLDLEITGVCPPASGRARLAIERFVGGGFAGQVYRVKLEEPGVIGGVIAGLDTGRVYAAKIIIPPSSFARMFRNGLFEMAYQGPFAPQVNLYAARTGVLWQKLIRRAAGIRFGDERAVADTYATFFDPVLGSYGEINEWIDGRNWRFEIDDAIFSRSRRKPGDDVPSAEYLTKKKFMADLVRLFHDVGAPELARQYEWWTCKSQPNVLKRTAPQTYDGLTALDFRAGLALLPFVPMSPADIPLILKGFATGKLVQFDRGNLDKLEAFIENHPGAFADLRPAIEELRQVDPAYRASLPDVTHHGFRLVYDPNLRRNVKNGLCEGWRVRRLVDDRGADKLKRSFFGFWLFMLLGLVPFLGRFIRRQWRNSNYARHIRSFLSDYEYTRRAWRAALALTLAEWLRKGRIGEQQVSYYQRHPGVFWVLRVFPGILPLPAKWHRFLTDWRFAWQAAKTALAYPIRFYRDPAFRVEWLTNEVEAGANEGMLTDHEHDYILSRVSDPFIQKYLKCVAVHVCTLPVTQVIAVLIAVYAYFAFAQTWEEGMLWAVGVLAFFQATPISPGSLVRGTYVVYLMIKERNIRNYWLAVLVSYWHYIGYLGFPLQMVKEFPALARFMGGRWATKMVRIVPVFGERGALLEHWIFDIFFNVPLSLKRLVTPKKKR